MKSLFYVTRDELLRGEEKKIWQEISPKAFARVKLGRQWFLYVDHTVFQKIALGFNAEPLRKGHWRSKGNMVHLHAVEESESCMNVHVDFLNPSRNPILMFGHFFTDVLPTSIWASLLQKRLILRPYHKEK